MVNKRMSELTRCLAMLAFILLTGAGTSTAVNAAQQHVVLAGGCFWGMEGVFESLKGVSSVVSGYAGGNRLTAHYEIVSTGLTGHAESVDVTYDPARVSFKQLLDVYFLVAHDPTQLNRQGPDEGSQYRSEIFYTSDTQRREALDYIRQLSARKVFRNPVVTKVAALQAFYPAEAYHQHFMQRNPDNPYIVYNDKPKIKALRNRFPNLINAK
ncbi:MAG: peptide-methionine (S)-S-oxide reductase MsrA [Candidatus Eremiobacteraeota bacterium]|nr:peptide-methionine (S)-S-oxide reductase MsrA [Candidatus Eremiobacteraeota bacterium]